MNTFPASVVNQLLAEALDDVPLTSMRKLLIGRGWFGLPSDVRQMAQVFESNGFKVRREYKRGNQALGLRAMYLVKGYYDNSAAVR